MTKNRDTNWVRCPCGRNHMTPEKDRLLKVEEAADRIGYSVGTVRMKILKREWPYIKLGRSVRIKESFIDELIVKGEVPARAGRAVERESLRPMPEDGGFE